MALTLADAVVFIRGDTSTLNKDLKGAEKSTTKFFGSFSSAVNGLMAGAIAGGAALAVAGLVKVGTTAVNVAFEMDSLERKFTQTLGVSADRAQELGDLVQDVYVRGLGDSLTDVADAVTVVNQALGDLELSDTAIADATANALLLRDAFELDVAESIRTVSILLKSGLAPDAETAFNIITAGMQEGLNISDDFLDTLNEYADDFARLGFTADETLGLINAGLDAGIFNTDKIGDLLNEFGVRIREVDTEKLGDIDEKIGSIISAFQGGEITEKDAFQQIIDRLNEIEDPIERNQLGVELFGSMWEDLGEKAVLALGDFDDASITTEGRIDDLQRETDNLSTRFDRLKRRAEVALEPLGETIVGLLEDSFPALEAALVVFETVVGNWKGSLIAYLAVFGVAALMVKNALQEMLDKIGLGQDKIDKLVAGAQKWLNIAGGVGNWLGIGGGSSSGGTVSDPLYTPGAGTLPPIDPGAGGYGGTSAYPPQLGATDQNGNSIQSQPGAQGTNPGGFGFDPIQMYPNAYGTQNIQINIQRGATDDETGNSLVNALRRKGNTP